VELGKHTLDYLTTQETLRDDRWLYYSKALSNVTAGLPTKYVKHKKGALVESLTAGR